jgi:hypothetical protein
MNFDRAISQTMGRQEIVSGLPRATTGIEQPVRNSAPDFYEAPDFYWVPPEKREIEPAAGNESPTTAAPTNSPRHTEVPLIRKPPVELVPRQLEVLQRFEGTVRSVHQPAGEMVVELRDLTHPDAPREVAILELSDVSDPDLEMVAPGAVFYWTIGYEVRTGTRQKTRISELRFRRYPTWKQRDVDQIQREADALASFFGSAR